MNVIYILAISQGIFFVIFLFFQRHKSQANYLLIGWLFIICFSLCINYTHEIGLMREYPILIGLDSGILYTYGPFLWFYTQLITRKSKKLTWASLIHLTPFIAYSIYLYFTLIIKSDDYKLALLDQTITPFSTTHIIIIQGSKIIHALLYIVLTYGLILKYQKNIKIQFSNIEHINLKWLQWLIISILVVTTLMGAVLLNIVYPNSISNAFTFPTINIVLFLLIYIIVFFALKYPHIFRAEQTLFLEPISDQKKYAQSILSDQECDLYWKKLKEYMLLARPFTDPNLLISELAEQLSLNQKLLSQVINRNYGGNFFNFINSYRVNEFKLRVGNDLNSHLTLFGIASKCGFSSKSSFHSIFKKFENCTPKEFIDTQLVTK